MGLTAELERMLEPERVLSRWIDRIAYANDASVYRLVPQAVVRPRSLAEIDRLFQFSQRHRVPLTFRAAGTSLSGQAVTDGLLVDVSRHWREVEVLDDGRRVRVQPGAIAGVVNRRLLPFGTRIGPDPASINACMMGGVLANNSSGMCCGVERNAYHTLESMRFMLPGGTLLDSNDPQTKARLEREEPRIFEGLLELRRRVLAQPDLVQRIRTKYGMKNTNGYSLNALLDFEHPLDVLSHLMIGSEGTLGFIAEAVLRTIPDLPFKQTGLLYFADVQSACAAIAPLRESGAEALELMDRASLRAIDGQPGVPSELRELPEAAAALLVEYQCRDEQELEARGAACRSALPDLALLGSSGFTRDPERQDALWRVRKGLIPSVGAMRARGTSFIIEDVVFPVASLARAVGELQQLFRRHRYHDAIVFGHAKDGNLHFVLTQAFDDPAEVARYDSFMKDLAVVVVDGHGGALKAEHGTGRNMAPFVAKEWGLEAYRIMREIKLLIDPAGLLNPGVLINDDPHAHLRHLKDLPQVEAEVDACIECGFCERLCPSRDLTLTPRQRIVVRREMSRLRAHDPGSPVLRGIQRSFRYDGLDTCAADGLCATACPVGIDTGALVKRLRGESRSAAAHELARALADRFALLETGARFALRVGNFGRRFLGDRGMTTVTRLLQVIVPRLPAWGGPQVPRAAVAVSCGTSRSAAAAVYLPNCVSRVMGPPGGDPELPELARVIERVAQAAARPVWIPSATQGLCCGLPFSSKGFAAAAARMLERTAARLWEWTEGGRLPVLVDASPCAQMLKTSRDGLSGRARHQLDAIEILDGIEFAHRYLLPGLRVVRRSGPVALHPPCSAVRMDLTGAMREIAERCAVSVEIPLLAGCCGFAGDRGFWLPQLTRAAMAPAAREIQVKQFAGHYSSSRTCEIGLSRATGRSYRSLWYLIDQTTRVGT